MPDIVETLVERLEPLLGARDGEIRPLGGGITNHNYRVRLGGEEYAVRVTSPGSALLGIDREAEHEAACIAATLGIAPEVAAFLPDAACLVTRYVPGLPIAPERLREPAALEAVGLAVRRLHDGPRFSAGFSAFRTCEDYARRAADRGATLPAALGDALAEAAVIEAALGEREADRVSCHNDLLNANLLDVSGQVMIVDWELAGTGSRWFDLGNLAVNNGLDEDHEELLLRAYQGRRPTARDTASLRLMRIVSDLREAMWAVVQSVASDLDFDYGAYAETHLRRMHESAADPRFGSWLQAARG